MQTLLQTPAALEAAMLWNWLKKPKRITRDQARAEGEAIKAFLKPHWARYAASLPANDTMPLSARMKLFVAQTRKSMDRKYRDAPDEILLNMVVILALEANTHSVHAVEAAIVDIKPAGIEDQVKADVNAIVASLGPK